MTIETPTPTPAAQLATAPARPWRNLLPEPADPVDRVSWRDAMPKTRVQWAAAIVLWILLLVYLVFWTAQHREWLFDPTWQNDDARIHLFAFHAYDSGALADDPIARQMLSFTPPVLHGVYRVLVPMFGVLVSAKIVQGFMLLIVAAAAVLLAKSRRAGLACAVVLVFLVLHSNGVMHRMAGGMARGFTYPLLVLWGAGAMIGSGRVRWVAALLAAAIYPPAMLLALGAEGVLEFAAGSRAWRTLGWRLARWALLVVLCAAVFAPYSYLQKGYGSTPTLEQAQKDPVFGPGGRTPRLPRETDAADRIVSRFATPFMQVGRGTLPSDALYWRYAKTEDAGPLALLAVLTIAILAGLAPPPREALAMICAAVVTYTLAWYVAFKLYIPVRYIEYGMTAAGLIFGVGVLGRFGYRVADSPRRFAIQSFAAAGAIVAMLLLTGTGEGKDDGMHITSRENPGVIGFARSLPPTALIAAHPMDANHFPLWSARSVVISVETCQPWLDKNWAKQKPLIQSTLGMMYATRREDVLRFVEAHGVTHIVIQRERYGPDVVRLSRTFEPLTTWARQHLEGKRREDLVLSDPPREAVVYEDETWIVLDAAKLREAWSARGE